MDSTTIPLQAMKKRSQSTRRMKYRIDLARLIAPGEVLKTHQFCWLNAKRLSQPTDIDHRNISLSTLNPA